MHVCAVAVATVAGTTAVNQEASGREEGRTGGHMCSANSSNSARSSRGMRRRAGICAAPAAVMATKTVAPVLAAEAVVAGAVV